MTRHRIYGRPLLLLTAALLLAGLPARAHQLVLTTGYANSQTPETGPNIDTTYPPFRSGGGYAVGVRVDIERRDSPLWITPSFLYWNNLTGDPDPNADATYFQIEFGGRVSYHSRNTEPTLYGGAGVGYSFAHGTVTAKATGAKTEFDGDFPTASLHIGAKTRSSGGITLLAEGSYHFGLSDAPGRLAVGPSNAWLIQIGVGLDILAGNMDADE